MSNKEKNNLVLDDKNSLPFDFFEDDFKAEEAKEPKSTKEETSTTSQESAKEESTSKKETPNDENIDQKEQKTKKTQEPIAKDLKEKKQTISSTKEKSPSKKTKSTSSVITSSGSTTGQILQEARVRKNLSLDQVSLSTRINKHFIEDLENDDSSNLPSAVYVIAYIKTLANLYEIDYTDLLSGKDDANEKKSVPDSLLSHLENGKQVNHKEEAKVKKFLRNSIVALIIIAVTIFFLLNYINTPTTPVKVEKDRDITKPSKDLTTFIYQKPFTMTELPIPK